MVERLGEMRTGRRERIEKGSRERIEKGSRERIEIEGKDKRNKSEQDDNLKRWRRNINTYLFLLFSFLKALQRFCSKVL